MILLQNISFGFPEGSAFQSYQFNNTISYQISFGRKQRHGKINPAENHGKQTTATGRNINIQGEIFYVPQMFGNFNDLTIAECLKIDQKLLRSKKLRVGKWMNIILKL
jgi:ABC-type branched-subunit amino acid transport system ATPase component